MTGLRKTRRPLRLTALGILLALTACGSDSSPRTVQSPPSPTTTRWETPPSRTAEAPETGPTPEFELSAEAEAALVTYVAADGFDQAREPLLAALKADRMVEAVEDFTFDRERRTLTLRIASIFRASEDARAELAYDLATQLSPLMWNAEIAGQVKDHRSLPFLSLAVDGQTYRCAGPAMAALADKELSAAQFPAQCKSA
jgi:hypothetical protein